MKVLSEGLNLSGNALKVLKKRYLKKDENGKITETPEELFRRVARTIASADLKYGKTEKEVKSLEDEFYSMMTSLEFLPNSPTLMNAGRRLGQLSACFVLPIGDSMESIFDAVKYAAIIHKSGGGTGFSFSRLRPKGDVVGSTKGISSGPVSFMIVFDTATEAVKQGGTRRGANMGILRIDHPDILQFITCKGEDTKLNNFNISVALTDGFMKAVEEDADYDLINPRTKKVAETLRARDVFNLIVEHAWKNGEPGIVFIDRVNEGNPTPNLGVIESTNPCGEQPLLAFESCNLGSINLSVMVEDRRINWQRLKSVTHHAVHFLDNVIDVNKYPLSEIEKMTKASRKIGLGIMGWADMLILLGIPYNSSQAIELAGEVMGFIQKEGRAGGEALAEERGVFPNFKGSVYDGNMKVRNATITTIAPTGTLSIIAGCSSGIEPLFAVSYVRTVMEGTKLIEVNPHFEAIAKDRGFGTRQLTERIAEQGSLHNIAEVPEDVKRLFVTAHDITPEEHIRMQASFQKYTDNAVSKTVNFPNHATKKDVEDVYMLAYRLGCKGVTVYRDGSRDEQVLTKSVTIIPPTQTVKIDVHPSTILTERKTEDTIDVTVSTPVQKTPRVKIIPQERPEVVIGTTRLIKTGCGNLYVTINEDEEGHLFELFTSMGKAGGCASSQAEALGRLISLALRSNIEPQEIVKQLKGVRCHQPAWESGGQIFSCSDAIAKALEKYYSRDEKGNRGDSLTNPIMLIGQCPECGGAVEHEGGCAVCHNCGFTKCG